MPKDDTPTPKRLPPEALRSELIMTLKPGAAVDRATLDATVKSAAGAHAEIRALFKDGETLKRQSDELRSRGVTVPDLSGFYEIVAPEETYDDIIAALSNVADVYRKPPADAPQIVALQEPACGDTPCRPCCWAPDRTPDFEPREHFAALAPGGIDARHTWQRNALGAGVDIVDIERAWRFTHEDIVGAPEVGKLDPVPPIDCLRERNHGTAVLGMLIGRNNGFGVRGICPEARVRGYSTRLPGVAGNPGTINVANAIIEATRILTTNYQNVNTGHILLLEVQRVHPERGFNLPVEWWLEEFLAIQTATAFGLIVVEAAGNGHRTTGQGANLDDPVWNTPLAGFHANWKNPFPRLVDSGAILVGAGAPPLGTPRADRSRLRYSNYGACVDVQGWGQEVVTTGFGCMQGGPDEDRWYMGDFGGTSAASAMIAGVLACVQGHRRATGKALLTSTSARDLLKAGGSPQVADGAQYPLSQRIGPRPDLRPLVP